MTVRAMPRTCPAAFHQLLEGDGEGRHKGKERVVTKDGEGEVLLVRGALAGERDSGDVEDTPGPM